MRFKKDFFEESKETNKYSKEEIDKAFALFNSSPAIMRKLAGIYDVNNGDLQYEVNPWFDEMENIGAESKDIEIILDYINFEEQKMVQERETYSPMYSNIDLDVYMAS